MIVQGLVCDICGLCLHTNYNINESVCTHYLLTGYAIYVALGGASHYTYTQYIAAFCQAGLASENLDIVSMKSKYAQQHGASNISTKHASILK